MKLRSIAILLVLSIFPFVARSEVLDKCATKTGTGWLERTEQGDRVLHLEGSYYDMGYQHGKLLQQETGLAIRAAKFAIYIKQPWLPPDLTVKLIYKKVASVAEPFIPAEFRDEIKGLSDASGVPVETILALHSITYLTSCSSAAAWGKATADGQLYFARSNDIAVVIDPLTGKSYHERALIVIYKPLDGAPYMMFTWPGFVGASDGMNANGIAIGNMSLPSRHETPAGIPMPFRIKQALAKAGTLDEAIEWMTKKPWEGGYNFIAADGKIPDARIIEMDSQTLYVGGWDGPAESNSYTYEDRDYTYTPLPDLLMRTNHPLSSELIAHRAIHMDDGKPHSRITYQRYIDLRARLAQAYGTITLVSLMDLWRAHYASINWEKGPSGGVISHQLSFAPQSGDFLVSFCKGNPFFIGRRAASAFTQPYHKYNLNDLAAEPAP